MSEVCDSFFDGFPNLVQRGPIRTCVNLKRSSHLSFQSCELGPHAKFEILRQPLLAGVLVMVVTHEFKCSLFECIFKLRLGASIPRSVGRLVGWLVGLSSKKNCNKFY